MRIECCTICKYWVALNDQWGKCHRYPPVQHWWFPETQLTDWCGEFKEAPIE